MALSQMAGRQLPLFSLIVPAWLVAMMSGWQGVKGCWPAILVCGGSFAVIQFCDRRTFTAPSLVDVVGGLGSLVVLALFLRFWQPREVWRFRRRAAASRRSPMARRRCAARQIAYAWVPWVLLSVVVFLWG